MKNPNDKLVKLLLRSGQVVHLYAEETAIYGLKNDYNFKAFRDDGNTIYVNDRDISAFEVLDERKPAEINPEAPLPQDFNPSQV